MGGGKLQVTRHCGRRVLTVSAGRANKPVERLWAVHALGTVLRAPFLDRGRYHGDIGRANAGAARAPGAAGSANCG